MVPARPAVLKLILLFVERVFPDLCLKQGVQKLDNVELTYLFIGFANVSPKNKTSRFILASFALEILFKAPGPLTRVTKVRLRMHKKSFLT